MVLGISRCGHRSFAHYPWQIRRWRFRPVERSWSPMFSDHLTPETGLSLQGGEKGSGSGKGPQGKSLASTLKGCSAAA